MILFARGACPLSRAARTGGRQAAHRAARLRDRAAKKPSHSTRRPIPSASIAGYEFDTDVIRYHYSSMTTPSEVIDYDLRTGERDSAQATGGAERPRPGRLRDPPPLRHGPGRRAGADLPRPPARTSLSTARRPACSTATAPTACRCRRASGPASCPSSTADSSMRSRMSAAAPRRAGAGISTASARRSRTRSRISSPAARP